MKGNKLTRKQHIARALLMGRVYDPRDGTYCRLDDKGYPVTPGMLCCETLTPMSGKTSSDRLASDKIQGYRWETVNYIPHTMPWEAPEDDERLDSNHNTT